MAGEKAPPPVDPYEAAKAIRTNVRSARDHLALVKTLGAQQGENFKYRARQAKNHRDVSISFDMRVDQRIEELRVAAATRRVSAMESAIANLKHSIDRKKNNDRDGWGYVNGMIQEHPPGENESEASHLRHAKKSLDKVRDLAMSLPTVNDMPQGNAENVLRAVIATLRYSGIAGTENLRWEEVLENGESQENGPAENGGVDHEGEAEEGVENTNLGIIDFGPVASGAGGGGSSGGNWIKLDPAVVADEGF